MNSNSKPIILHNAGDDFSQSVAGNLSSYTFSDVRLVLLRRLAPLSLSRAAGSQNIKRSTHTSKIDFISR